MFFHFDDFDRTFSRLGRLDQALYQAGLARAPRAPDTSEFELAENADEIVLTVDLPGVSEEQIEVSLEQDVLSISARRHVEVPEGFRARRVERQNFEFTRSFSLPTRVDPERVAATLADGVFSIRMAKAAEVKPRQITVQAR